MIPCPELLEKLRVEIFEKIPQNDYTYLNVSIMSTIKYRLWIIVMKFYGIYCLDVSSNHTKIIK